MRLTNIAVLAIKGAGVELRDKIMEALGITSQNTYYKYLNTNSIMFTTAAVLAAIREATGLSDDQILEQEKEPVPAFPKVG